MSELLFDISFLLRERFVRWLIYELVIVPAEYKSVEGNLNSLIGRRLGEREPIVRA